MYSETSNFSSIMRLLMVSLCLVLASCSNVIRTQVNTFAHPDLRVEGQKLAVIVGAEEDAQSLESALYVAKLEKIASAKGFTVVTAGEGEDLVMELSYSLQRLEDVPRDTNRAYIATSTSVRRARGSLGLILVEDADKVANYHRQIEVIIRPSEVGKQRLYEATAVSEGRCGVISEVIDEMFTALFTDFPAGNGELKIIPVKATQSCK